MNDAPDERFWSLGMTLEKCIPRTLPWLGLQPIIAAIAVENNL